MLSTVRSLSNIYIWCEYHSYNLIQKIKKAKICTKLGFVANSGKRSLCLSLPTIKTNICGQISSSLQRP